jgi:hypothetical protein
MSELVLGMAGLLELFQVNAGELYAANEWLAFAQTMAVGAAGDGQMQALGQRQIVFALRAGLFGMKAFQAIQPN